MITVEVNGVPKGVEPDTPVGVLVAQILGAEPLQGVAVALNGEVVLRAEWATVIVKDRDAVEIIRAIQGG